MSVPCTVNHNLQLVKAVSSHRFTWVRFPPRFGLLVGQVAPVLTVSVLNVGKSALGALERVGGCHRVDARRRR